MVDTNNVLLDTSTFAAELSQQDLDSLVGLNYHHNVTDGMLLQQHQLVAGESGVLQAGVESVVEVAAGGGGADHPLGQDIGDVASMLQHMEGVEHFVPNSMQNSPAFSISSTMDFVSQTTTPVLTTSPQGYTTQSFTTQGYTTSPQGYTTSPQGYNTTSSYLQDSLEEEVDSGIGDITGYTSVSSNAVDGAPHATTFQLLSTDAGGVADTGGGMMDRVGGVVDRGTTGGGMLDRGDSGVHDMDHGVSKGVTLENAQIIRTTTGQFFIKQSPIRNDTNQRIVRQQLGGELKTGNLHALHKQGITKLFLNATTQPAPAPHQQIRLLPASTAPRTVVVGGGGKLPGSIVGSIGTRSVVVSSVNSSGSAVHLGGGGATQGAVTTKLTLQQAQKLGLLSPTKVVTTSTTKLVMRQVAGSGNRLLFTQVPSNSSHSSVPQTLILKSPAKIAPAPQQVFTTSSGSTVLSSSTGLRVLPASSSQHQKIVIKSSNQIHKGVVRSQLFEAPATAPDTLAPQSVIRISAANPAVQAAASASLTTSKANLVRLVSPGPSSGGNKLIAPNNAQHIKIKPVSIAPSTQSTTLQQQCVLIPVTGNNILTTNNNNNTNSGGIVTSKSNSVVMIPFQYLNQLQTNFTLAGNIGSSASSTIITSDVLSVSGEVVPPRPTNTSSTTTSSSAKAPPPRKTIIDANGIKARKPCNCNKSQCLKLYCDCFANGEFCNNCNCSNCYNNLSHEEDRQKAIKSCLDRNPKAFKPKIGKGGTSTERRHNKGCNCKRSGCLKNYCECYEAKIPCTSICKCYGCQNIDNATLVIRRKILAHPPDPSTIITSQLFTPSPTSPSPTFGDTKPSIGGIIGGGGGGAGMAASVGGVTGSILKSFGVSSPSKLRLSRAIGSSIVSSSGSSSNGPPSSPPVTYKISQEVVSATCGCIIATASRCQKLNLDKRATELAVIKEFSNCLQHIIQSCMQTSKSRANS